MFRHIFCQIPPLRRPEVGFDMFYSSDRLYAAILLLNMYLSRWYTFMTSSGRVSLFPRGLIVELSLASQVITAQRWSHRDCLM